MKELSNICKPVLELVYGDDGLTSNRLFKRLNFLCSQNESCKNRKIFSNSICTYNCFRMISDFDKIDEIFFINEQFRLCFYKNQTKVLKELSDFIFPERQIIIDVEEKEKEKAINAELTHSYIKNQLTRL